MKKYKNKSMKTHAKLSYMSRCYAALKVNQHFNHETKNDFFQELETSIFKKTIFNINPSYHSLIFYNNVEKIL